MFLVTLHMFASEYVISFMLKGLLRLKRNSQSFSPEYIGDIIMTVLSITFLLHLKPQFNSSVGSTHFSYVLKDVQLELLEFLFM
jgi:hypothetical protein